MKAVLELSPMQINTKNNEDDLESETDSLNSLIKGIKILTIRIPCWPEGWGLFFFLILWKDYL